MRITVTVKGEIEDYVQEQINKTGLSSAMILLNLAMQGFEYKQALSTMSTFAQALGVQADQLKTVAIKNKD